MKLTREQLYSDLHEAYMEARRHKRGREYQQKFEADMYWQLKYLSDELYEHRYRPLPATCFIVCDPKKREIVAAEFRDRIVHHLYYNYTHELFERTFTQDTYSCIAGRGTLYGIRRMERHIREESRNYTCECYVLKFDVRGYFMGIDRQRLLSICRKTFRTMNSHRICKSSSDAWGDRLDMVFVDYLTELIITLDPLKDCRCMGWPAEWEGLPETKSLFYAKPGCGLPIGNLTSQLFSNVYMNVLDQWMKRTVGCRHYGRYVDDFYVVSTDREWLHSLIPQVQIFLRKELGLELNQGKTQICNVRYGVQYLGAYIKPWRSYVSSKTLRHMEKKIRQLEQTLPMPDPEHLRSSLSSMLGLMRQHSSYNLRQQLVQNRLQPFCHYGYFDCDLTKFTPWW